MLIKFVKKYPHTCQLSLIVFSLFIGLPTIVFGILTAFKLADLSAITPWVRLADFLGKFAIFTISCVLTNYVVSQILDKAIDEQKGA